MQLPPVCRYQEIEYTFSIKHKNGTTVMLSGPYNHIGSGAISVEISLLHNLYLERDTEYLIIVAVNTSHGASQTSESSFRKLLQISLEHCFNYNTVTISAFKFCMDQMLI